MPVETLGSPVVADETVYIGDSDGLHALDATSGETRWDHESEHGFRTPAVVDGTVYATNSDGLHALDAATGEARWQCQIEGELSAPAVAGNTVYLTNKEESVYAIARE